MFETTKAIVIERPRHAALKDIRLPEVDDTSIVVRTRCSAISTGTEIKIWNGKTGKLGGNLWYPTVPGYEQVGVVEYVGPNAIRTYAGEEFEVGDRVMANEVRAYPDHCASWGGQVELSVKNLTVSDSPFDMPAKIPEDVSDQEATLAYLAAVAEKGIGKIGIEANETVVVIGMGAVGFSALQLAKKRAKRVIAVDKSQWRVERAKNYADDIVCVDAGHDACVEAISDLTGGDLADVVIECSGDSYAVNNIRRITREGGWEFDDDGARIHLQGDYPEPISFTPYHEWFNRNLRVSMSCAIKPGGKERILEMIRTGEFDAKVLWDKVIPVAEAPDEYAELERDRDTRMKTLLEWS